MILTKMFHCPLFLLDTAFYHRIQQLLLLYLCFGLYCKTVLMDLVSEVTPTSIFEKAGMRMA